jgi:hypothetical protein
VIAAFSKPLWLRQQQHHRCQQQQAQCQQQVFIDAQPAPGALLRAQPAQGGECHQLALAAPGQVNQQRQQQRCQCCQCGGKQQADAHR